MCGEYQIWLDYFICLLTTPLRPPLTALHLAFAWERMSLGYHKRSLGYHSTQPLQRTRGSGLVRQVWAVQTQPMLPCILLETLLDCSRFQNKQGDLQAQSQTIHTENGNLSRHVTSSLHHYLWFHFRNYCQKVLIICTILPSVALLVLVNLPTTNYWSCILEWCISPHIPL